MGLALAGCGSCGCGGQCAACACRSIDAFGAYATPWLQQYNHWVYVQVCGQNVSYVISIMAWVPPTLADQSVVPFWARGGMGLLYRGLYDVPTRRFSGNLIAVGQRGGCS